MKRMLRLALAVAVAALAAPALAQTATATFQVSANVVNSCALQLVTNMSFGQYDALSATPTDGTSTFQFRCNRNTGFRIALDNGQNFGQAAGFAASRAMTNGGNFLAYNLFSDTNRTVAWGSTQGTNTVDGTAPNSGWVPLTIYGRVPAGQDVPGAAAPGLLYTDAPVTITVNF